MPGQTRLWTLTLSEKKTEREGCHCLFQKSTPAQNVGTRSKAVSTQGSKQVCFSWCPKSYNSELFAIRAIFPEWFPGLSQKPWEPPTTSRKQPRPSQVFLIFGLRSPLDVWNLIRNLDQFCPNMAKLDQLCQVGCHFAVFCLLGKAHLTNSDQVGPALSPTVFGALLIWGSADKQFAHVHLRPQTKQTNHKEMPTLGYSADNTMSSKHTMTPPLDRKQVVGVFF